MYVIIIMYSDLYQLLMCLLKCISTTYNSKQSLTYLGSITLYTSVVYLSHVCLLDVILVDSQGSADTSRSQHTDVTSELSSVVSVPDKTGMFYYTCMYILYACTLVRGYVCDK